MIYKSGDRWCQIIPFIHKVLGTEHMTLERTEEDPNRISF